MSDVALELYNANGNVIFGDSTSNVTVLGIVNTGKSNGSLVNDQLSLGIGVIIQALPTEGYNPFPPRITISGNTLSWSFKVSGANYNTPFRVIYGVRA